MNKGELVIVNIDLLKLINIAADLCDQLESMNLLPVENIKSIFAFNSVDFLLWVSYPDKKYISRVKEYLDPYFDDILADYDINNYIKNRDINECDINVKTPIIVQIFVILQKALSESIENGNMCQILLDYFTILGKDFIALDGFLDDSLMDRYLQYLEILKDQMNEAI